MTLRRPSATGRDRSERRRSLPILLLALVAVVVVACGGAATPTTPATPDATATDLARSPDAPTSTPDEATDDPDEPDATDEPVETEVPAETATPAPTEAPSDAPSDEPSTAPGSADACSGNAGNRDFYASVADAVSWTVYCPVLPKGWFVESGQYRLAGGGRMEISYRGPGGATLMLREGAFCDGGDCVPDGDDAGSAAFGDLQGTLIAADGDAWAIVVDPGRSLTWLVEGSGLGQAAFEAIAADLISVGG